jgi:hypothetical protein
MSYRPSYPTAGYNQSQQHPPSQSRAGPAMFDQQTRVYYAQPAAPYPRSQQYTTSQVYYYPNPYNPANPGYPQEQIMVVHPQPDPVYPANRPPAPPDSSFHRLATPVQPSAPAPRAPSKPASGSKARMSQPSVHGPTQIKPHPPLQPPPPALMATKPKPTDFQLQLPSRPTFVPDRRSPPGCFDIIGRGTFPRISFATEVET